MWHVSFPYLFKGWYIEVILCIIYGVFVTSTRRSIFFGKLVASIYTVQVIWSFSCFSVIYLVAFFGGNHYNLTNLRIWPLFHGNVFEKLTKVYEITSKVVFHKGDCNTTMQYSGNKNIFIPLWVNNKLYDCKYASIF